LWEGPPQARASPLLQSVSGSQTAVAAAAARICFGGTCLPEPYFRPAAERERSPLSAVAVVQPPVSDADRRQEQIEPIAVGSPRADAEKWRPEPESNRRPKATKPVRSAAPRRLVAPICGPRPQWLAAGDAHRFICSAAAGVAGRRLVGELLSGHARSIRWMAYHWAQGVGWWLERLGGWVRVVKI